MAETLRVLAKSLIHKLRKANDMLQQLVQEQTIRRDPILFSTFPLYRKASLLYRRALWDASTLAGGGGGRRTYFLLPPVQEVQAVHINEMQKLFIDWLRSQAIRFK